MKSIESLIKKVTRHVVKGSDRLIAQLIFDWPKIVGPKLNTITRPEKMVFATFLKKSFHKEGKTPPSNHYNKGKLYITVPHSAHAFELSMQHDALMHRINSYFGRPLVDTIRFKQGIIPINPIINPFFLGEPPAKALHPDILQGVNRITDNDLQQALLSLAKYLR